MREQIKQDIDLIEILFYLKKKIRVILFIMAICMAMVLLFLYINKDNIKVIYSLKINQTTPGILWICPYISRHLLSLNPLLACCRRYSRGER